jgi:hypothetical protein
MSHRGFVDRTKPITEPVMLVDNRNKDGNYFMLENWGKSGKKIVQYYFQCVCGGKCNRVVGKILNCTNKVPKHQIYFRGTYQFELEYKIKSLKESYDPSERAKRIAEFKESNQAEGLKITEGGIWITEFDSYRQDIEFMAFYGYANTVAPFSYTRAEIESENFCNSRNTLDWQFKEKFQEWVKAHPAGTLRKGDLILVGTGAVLLYIGKVGE